jgi:hypothetical protein
MAIIKIRNAAIDLDAAEIPNLPASKITSGTLDNARISLDAAEIPNLDTAKITTGTIATARLGSGTADATTFLRGDNTFASAGSPSIDDNGNAIAITITDAELVQVKNANDTGGLLSVSDGDSGATAHADANELVLEDNGSAGMSILTFNNTTGNIYFGDGQDNDIGKISYNHSDNTMIFSTGAVERFRAGTEVAVNDGAVDTGAAVFKVKGAQNNDVAIFVHKNTSGSEVMFRFRDGDQTTCGTIGIDTGGNSVSYNTSSDYRLKENVEYNFDATSRLKQLKPARFNFISNADKTVDGFLAHEVSSIVPEAIQGEKDAFEKYREHQEIPDGKSVGDFKLDENENKIPLYQGIDQSKLVPLLVKTIQELEARITELENA